MKKIFFLCAILIACVVVNGQVKPSDRRLQQQQKEESENKNQSPSEKRKKASEFKTQLVVFGDDDPLFKEKNVAEKWAKESAVVIYQKYDYTYMRANKTIEIDELVRRRVKLIDAAAIDEFAEFYFLSYDVSGSYSGSSDIGIRIVKSDGTEVPVDIKSAVKVNDNSVPSFYKSFYSSNMLEYKKLAIPDLVPGDIIDYYYKTHRSITDDITSWNFDPLYFTLNSSYPIANQKISFTVDRGFYINFNSYNGAPSLKEGEAGTDIHGRKRAMIKTYSLVDKDREKRPDDVWEYYFRDNPTVKFQVVYETSASKSTTRNFIGEIGIAKTKVEPEEISAVLSRAVRDESGLTFADDILKYLNKKFPKETDPEKIARESYYFYRKTALEYIFENPYGYTSKTKDEIISINDDKFVSALLQVFKKKNIDAYVLVTEPANLGKIEDILIGSEMTLGVMVKGKKPLYMFPFSNHSTFDMAISDYQDVSAYVMKLERNSKANKYEKIVIPAASYSENVLNMEYTVSVDNAMENLTVNRTSKIKGAFKSGYYYRAMYNYDYMKDDKIRYDPKYKADAPAKGNKSRMQEEKRKADAKEEEKKKDQYDSFKEQLEEDFEIVSFDDFKIVSPGRYDDAPELIYTETFKVKDMLSKAGKNYFLNAGKFIGGQIELKEKQMKRTTDYYTGYARTISNEVKFELPSGFTADGLNEMTFNVDNASGSFISTAKIEGNSLVIKTAKTYKKIHGTKDEWQGLVDVMEAAYKFTQKKVVLKKA